MSKRGISMQRHREIGLELAAISDRLVHLATEVGNAYPISGPKGAFHRRLNHAIRRLAEARSTGENIMFTEHGHNGTPSTYYPPREIRVAYHAQMDADATTAYEAVTGTDVGPPTSGE